MHEGVLDDHTDVDKNLCSTEKNERGTMLHEAGHALFGLADEYSSGDHWQLLDLPNNWLVHKQARTDAPNRNKAKGDVERVTHGVWKICDKPNDNCQMRKAGSTITGFDEPCIHRVYYTIRENAGCTQP
jgi:hypothetical protein